MVTALYMSTRINRRKNSQIHLIHSSKDVPAEVQAV